MIEFPWTTSEEDARHDKATLKAWEECIIDTSEAFAELCRHNNVTEEVFGPLDETALQELEIMFNGLGYRKGESDDGC